MRRQVRVAVLRCALILGSVLAMLPLTTTTFAWNQPICNPNTGEVLQASQFPNEAAYNKYLHDHPGSFKMSPGQRCQKTAQSSPPPQSNNQSASAPQSNNQPVSAPQNNNQSASAPQTSSQSSSGGQPAGAAVCVV